MANVLSVLEAYNRGRDPELLAMKYEKMRADPFVFLRGSCHLFYASLPRHTLFKTAPLVWACGDLHLENCGSYRGDNGQVYFDINDFDESVRAPACWDLLRVVTSVLVARRTLGISATRALALGTSLVDAYADALCLGVARWLERETAQPPVRGLLDDARRKKARALVDKRTKGKGAKRRIDVTSGKALPARAEQVHKVKSLFARYGAHGAKRSTFEVLDVARRIAGTGSLGVERYVVLVQRRGEQQPQLLDLKAALPPCALPRRGAAPSADDATRIVRNQLRMQAIPIAWLDAVQIAGQPFVLRELLPSEDRIDAQDLHKKPEQLRSLLHDIGSCLAWDQLRASGRDGSAIADALIAYGRERTFRAPLLQLAQRAAERVEQDYAAFVRAYRPQAL